MLVVFTAEPARCNSDKDCLAKQAKPCIRRECHCVKQFAFGDGKTKCDRKYGIKPIKLPREMEKKKKKRSGYFYGSGDIDFVWNCEPSSISAPIQTHVFAKTAKYFAPNRIAAAPKKWVKRKMGTR